MFDGKHNVGEKIRPSFSAFYNVKIVFLVFSSRLLLLLSFYIFQLSRKRIFAVCKLKPIKYDVVVRTQNAFFFCYIFCLSENSKQKINYK